MSNVEGQKPQANKIGVIVAMDKEFSQLRSLLDEPRLERFGRQGVVVGRLGESQVALLQCGIGKVNAAVGAVEMLDAWQPSLVVSSGVAGGAEASLKPLDVVVARECAYHDVYCGPDNAYGQIQGLPLYYKAPAELIDRALSLAMPEGSKIVAGLTVSGDWFVDSKEKMREILQHFPAATAVDMESCAIAQVCHLRATPFVSFRTISDVPLNDTGASQYFDFWNRVAAGSFHVTRDFLASLTITKSQEPQQ